MVSISTSQRSEAVRIIQRRRFQFMHVASIVDLLCIGVFRWKRRRILARFPWDMVLLAPPDDSLCRCWIQSHRLRLQRLRSLRCSTPSRNRHLVQYSQRPPSYPSSSSASKGILLLLSNYGLLFCMHSRSSESQDLGIFYFISATALIFFSLFFFRI